MSHALEGHGYLCQLNHELTKACKKTIRRQNSDFGIGQYYDKEIDPQNPAMLNVTSGNKLNNTNQPHSSLVVGGGAHKNSRF